MNEYLDRVKSDLKRLDHIIYVSLKYTRTVDIIKHALDRMISAFDNGFDGLLEKAKTKKKIIEIPEQPRKKCRILKETYPNNEKLMEYIDFYLLLRDLSQAEYTKREEFRRHVTMIADIGKEELVEVNIDVLNVYYVKMKEFLEYLEVEFA